MLNVVRIVLKNGKFWYLLWQHFLHTRYPSCYPNNNIKTLKDVQTDVKYVNKYECVCIRNCRQRCQWAPGRCPPISPNPISPNPISPNGLGLEG